MEERKLTEESTYNGILYFGTWMEKLRLHELDTSGNFPVGIEYLKVSEDRASSCRKDTNEAIEQLGQSIEEHLQALGTTLSLLDRVASCVWGCSHGDHVLEYITGRVVGYSQSALLLAKSGLYDEALLLVRSIAEIANLFALFVADSTAFRNWKTFSEAKRISEFSPGKVRKRLDSLNVPIPYDGNQYGWLCEIAAHATPHTKPQVHQPNTRPSVGAIFQQNSFQGVLREISLSVAVLSETVAQLADIEDGKRDEIIKHGKILLSFI
jgi:hypothetical protein